MSDYKKRLAPKDGIHPDNKRAIKLIQKYFPDKNVSILDFGCGNGWLLNELYKEGYKDLTGVDYKTPTLINKTIKFKYCNLNNGYIDYKQKFDVVLGLHLIEHLKSPYNLINIAYNIIKDGGLFIIAHPDMSNIFHRFNFLLKGENMRFNKDNSNNVFITNNVFKRFLYGSDVYNIKNNSSKQKFLIKKRISSNAIMPVFHFKLPNIRMFEGSVIYVLQKNWEV